MTRPGHELEAAFFAVRFCFRLHAVPVAVGEKMSELAQPKHRYVTFQIAHDHQTVEFANVELPQLNALVEYLLNVPW